MTVDRGGLRYPIVVDDGFSANLRRFRDEIAKARTEFTRFRNASASADRGLSSAQNQLRKARTDAQREAAKEEKAARDQARNQAREAAREDKATRKAEEQALRDRLKQIAEEAKRRRELYKLRASATRDQEREEKRLQRVEQDAVRERLKAIKEEETRRREMHRLRAAATRDQAREQKRIDAEEQKGIRERLGVIQEEQKRIDQRNRLRASAERDLRKEQQRARTEEDRANKARNRAGRALADEAERATERQLDFSRSLRDTEGTANRLLFTFRRLVGVLALFTIAREASAAFAGLVRSGFEFNQTLERTRFGLAGILVAVSRVRDEQGNLVQGAEAFALAQSEARKQQELLRQQALSTVATYQELLDAFQVALGPGLAAGLNVDQVRQFAVLVSQAASNISLPQNQLSEEIRAILTGNIRTTTTRLAQVLNLTNEQIRELKAQGPDVFFEALQRKLEGFALGAESVATTVGGLAVRLKDVFELVAGRAAEDSFESLRLTFQSLFDTLTVARQTDFGRILEPNPRAQEAFNAIFRAINNILLRLREVGSSIGLDGLVNSAQLFANALEIAGTIGVDVIAGLIRGLSTLQTIFSAIGSAFSGFADLFPEGVGDELLSTFVQIATVVLGLRVAMVALTGTVGRLVGFVAGLPIQLGLALLRVNNLVEATKIWVKETKVGAAVMQVIASRAALIAGSFTALVFGLKLISEQILGFEVQLSDLPELFGAMFERVFTKILAFGDSIFATITVRAKQAFNALIAEAEVGLEKVRRLFDLELGASDSLKDLARRESERDIAKIRNNAARENLALEKQLVEQADIRKQQSEDANAQEGDRINRLRDQAALRENEAKTLTEILRAQREAEIAAQTGRNPSFEPNRPGISIEDRKALAETQDRIALRRLELQLQRESFDLQSNGFARERQESELQVAALERKLALTRETGETAIAFFREENAANLRGLEGEEAQKLAQSQYNALLQEQLLTEAEIALAIERQRIAAEEARLVEQGSITEGLGRGLADFGQQFSSSFLAGIEIAKGALQAFSQFASQSITDALDPNANSDTHKENFGRFLKAIGDLIIQKLVELAIAKAILGLGLGTPTPGGLQGGGSVGLRRGGRVPRRASASAAHYGVGVRGLAHGGRPVPPKGVDRRDNVPIWAQKGEFMMRVDAVRQYGLQAMEALNRGAIDPTALKALTGARRLASATKHRGRISYQSGGEIQQAAAQAQGAVAQSGGTSAQSGGIMAGMIVANEQAAGRILRGGSKAVLDFVNDFGPDIESRLRKFRS